MFRNKKAEEGGSVAIVLIIIALFMTFYILFIPPADRDILLNQSSGTQDQTSTVSQGKVELLFGSPGLLNPNEEFGTMHPLQDINLFVKTEPKIVSLAQNLNVKNDLFSKSFPVLRFQSSDLEETKSVALNFFISKAEGELRIKLNGNTIYTEEVQGSGSKIVNIAVQDLKANNEIEFSVSSPGIAFWAANNYNLKDVIVKQEFSRINSEESRTFTVSEQEKSTLQSVNIKYTQVCMQPLVKESAPLTIYVNDKRASSNYITCRTASQSLDVDSSLLVEGNNKLEFKLEDGDFLFSGVSIETKSSDSKFPTFPFSLPSAEYKLVSSGSKTVSLDLLVPAKRGQKAARILINNNEILMNTDSTSFTRDISSLVIEGTNVLQIIPTSTFSINSLKVTLN